MVSVLDYFLQRNFCNNLAPIWKNTSLTWSLGSFIVQMHQVVIAFIFHLFSVPLTRSQISQVHIVQNMKMHSWTKKLLHLLHFHLDTQTKPRPCRFIKNPTGKSEFMTYVETKAIICLFIPCYYFIRYSRVEDHGSNPQFGYFLHFFHTKRER